MHPKKPGAEFFCQRFRSSPEQIFWRYFERIHQCHSQKRAGHAQPYLDLADHVHMDVDPIRELLAGITGSFARPLQALTDALGFCPLLLYRHA